MNLLEALQELLSRVNAALEARTAGFPATPELADLIDETKAGLINPDLVEALTGTSDDAAALAEVVDGLMVALDTLLVMLDEMQAEQAAATERLQALAALAPQPAPEPTVDASEARKRLIESAAHTEDVVQPDEIVLPAARLAREGAVPAVVTGPVDLTENVQPRIRAHANNTRVSGDMTLEGVWRDIKSAGQASNLKIATIATGKTLHDDPAEAARESAELLAASCCGMPENDYDIQVFGTPASPFVDALPKLDGTRNLAVRSAIWADLTGPSWLPDTAGFYQACEDAGTEKNCDPAVCIPALTTTPFAVGHCFTVSTFNWLTDREGVDALRALLGVYFARRRENEALSAYFSGLSSSVLTAGTATFGANTDLIRAILRTVAHLADSIGYYGRWDVRIPAWLPAMLAGDSLTQPFKSTTLEELQTALQSINQDIQLGTYNGVAAGGTTVAVPGGQPLGFGAALPSVTQTGVPATTTITPGLGGAVPDWPAAARVLVYPSDAGFWRTHGTIDVELRETNLQSNFLKLFFEEIATALFPGLHWAVDVPLCDSGKAGALVDYTC